MTLHSYLELLDWTGRELRAGTHGVIPQGLESILDRLQVSAESWLETVTRFGRRFHRAVGLADHLKAEAQRLGVNWLQGVRSSQMAFAHSPLSLIASDPFLRMVANLPDRGLTGERREPDARILDETTRATPSLPARAPQLRASVSWARFVRKVLLSRQAN